MLRNDSHDDPGARRFDLVMRPHRSLGARGFWILMGLVSATGLAAGIVFMSAGA